MQNIWCKHYNGLIVNKTCDMDVDYESIRDKNKTGLDQYPCFKNSLCEITCTLCRFPTESEIIERERRIENEIETYWHKIENDTCPKCDKYILRLEQVGRCVYARPCGHRLYQGRLP